MPDTSLGFSAQSYLLGWQWDQRPSIYSFLSWVPACLAELKRDLATEVDLPWFRLCGNRSASLVVSGRPFAGAVAEMDSALGWRTRLIWRADLLLPWVFYSWQWEVGIPQRSSGAYEPVW